MYNFPTLELGVCYGKVIGPALHARNFMLVLPWDPLLGIYSERRRITMKREREREISSPMGICGSWI